MATIAIKVENLSKRYRIGLKEELHDTLGGALASWVKSPVSNFKSLRRLNRFDEDIVGEDIIWALKEMSFEVRQGEVVGIIGRNGAGKSTLLKVLSRITEPTSGRVTIRGRVSSLLEVGTGFHPELTGRENVYLNGAVLGMSKQEIDCKFDEIVAFAEVEKFIDTPVKRYSSGMRVRLAFAVAAHLEPEILLVDEVLAVGDAAFQRKCVGKMGDVAKEGRTVVFVSHQMGLVAQLCSKAFLLSKGGIAKEGDTRDVVEYYLNEVLSERNNGFTASTNSDKDIFITKAQSLNSKGEPTSHFTHTEEIVIAITCKVNRWLTNTVMGFFIRDHRGRKVFTNNCPNWDSLDPKDGEICVTATIPSNFLVPGQYMFTFAISVPHVSVVDWVEDAITITIIDGGSIFSSYDGYDYGCVFADCRWRIDSIEQEV